MKKKTGGLCGLLRCTVILLSLLSGCNGGGGNSGSSPAFAPDNDLLNSLPPLSVANQAPIVTAPLSPTTMAETAVSLPIQARDPDGDPLHYSVIGLPAGLEINAATGLISGILPPTAAADSPYTVTVLVSDGTIETRTSFLWHVSREQQAQIYLAWEAPTTNIDGSPAANLAGHKLYYGRISKGSAQHPTTFAYEFTVIITDPTTTILPLAGLVAGQTYYFAVTAFDTSGHESAFSNEASLTMPTLAVSRAAVVPADTDGDGLTDNDERNIYGTNSARADTDGDGINDGDEVVFWGNDQDADYDGDGVINLLDPDTDNDGFFDGVETGQGYDPADSTSKPQAAQWTDYRIALTVQSDDDRAIGIMFRYQDNEHYYRFAWDTQGMYRHLVKRQGGAFTLLAEDAVPYIPSQSYHLEIVAQETIVEVWIDGSLIFAVTDTGIPAGTIALYTWNNQRSVFDNVLVEDLATGAVLLTDDFNDDALSGWAFVDESIMASPSAWSAATGSLVQSIDSRSTSAAATDLAKLGAFALYAR